MPFCTSCCQISKDDDYCSNCGTSLKAAAPAEKSPRPPDIAPDTVIDFLKVGPKLASTGAINFYLAVNQKTGGSCLVETSIIRGTDQTGSVPNNGLLTLSLDEKRSLLSAIYGPGSVQYIDNGEMGLVIRPELDGNSLRNAHNRPQDDYAAAVRTIIVICNEVRAIHSQGYLSLEIEPENIYLESDKASFLDFSRALRIGGSRQSFLTADGFSAPELLTSAGNTPGFQADIYSIGALLYWMVTGQAPEHTDLQPEEINGKIESPELARTIAILLAADPGARPSDIDLLIAMLSRCLAKLEATFLEISAQSDCGMVRKVNEDNYLTAVSNNGLDNSSSALIVVADGMGGQQAGQVASRMAVDGIAQYLPEFLCSKNGVDLNQMLVDGVRNVNSLVFAKAQSSPEFKSMGTTFTAGLVRHNRLFLAHVGDSRVYLLRDGVMNQLTADHSVVAEMVKAGIITAGEARTHPKRSQIYRCLGTNEKIEVDGFVNSSMRELPVRPGDRLLFCSDGLYQYFQDEELVACIDKLDGASACHRLILESNRRGGADNITVVIADIFLGCCRHDSRLKV